MSIGENLRKHMGGDHRTGQSGNTGAERGTSDGLRDHLGTVVVVGVGYVLGAGLGLLGGGVMLVSVERAVGTAAADLIPVGGPLLPNAAAASVLFAGTVVLADLLAVRILAESLTVDWSGLAGWVSTATPLVAVPAFGLGAAIYPEVLGSAARTPETVTVALALAGATAVLVGVAGATVPLAVAVDGCGLIRAIRLATVRTRIAPRSTLRFLVPLVGGWTAGGALILSGAAVVVVAGLLIPLVGALLALPFVFLIWAGAGFAVAAGHVQYRLRTVTHYQQNGLPPV